MEINQFALYPVYNSRAEKTVQAQINHVTVAAPSGASTGTREAHNHIPDDLTSVEQELRSIFTTGSWTPQEIDGTLHEIDGTENFQRLGCVSTATSLAAWKAHGFAFSNTFPYPLGNMVGGGAHGGNTVIQEFLVLPVEASTLPEALETNAAIYREIRERYPRRVTGVNDESAYTLDMDVFDTLDMLTKLCKEYGARIGLDVAANTFYKDGTYHYENLGRNLDTDGQHRFLRTLIKEYNLVYVEDPFHEDDTDAFVELRETVTREEQDCWIVGDDLTVTHADQIDRAAEQGAITGAILKPNQVGTVSDTRKALETCREHSVLPVISHRSGETTDTMIADLAVAWEIPVIKAGVAGIRVAKLNRLLSLWNAADTPQLATLP